MVTKEAKTSRHIEAREPLPVPESARVIQRSIIVRLESLVKGSGSALDPGFQAAWQEALFLVDSYQKAIAGNAKRTAACAVGCSSCCCHWVEDVNSFEAEAIAARLKRSLPDRIPTIIDRCNRDNAALSQLNALIEAKLAMLDPAFTEAIDSTELLLASFYRLRKPCPLLEGNSRSCLVYPLRPFTCRMYVSFSDPVKCSPGYADDNDITAYLFDLEKRADELIDALHFKFMKFEGDTGLRSLLLKYLA
jgi:Fe-S-cluster containining protein